MNKVVVHIWALTQKEIRQIVRDKSAFVLGVILPIILIFLFGFGISFDVKDIQLGIVKEKSSQWTNFYSQALGANQTFDVHFFTSQKQAMQALKDCEIEAILFFNAKEQAQLLIDGVDAPRATMLTNAVKQTIGNARAAHGDAELGVKVVHRIWFNESGESRWYIVPGLMVIILTMTGTVLTGLVIAREWERGTMEALLATPVTPFALIVSKILPYFILAMLGWIVCLVVALLIYGLPLRGGMWLITLSSVIYLVFCLGLGLMVSALTRSQFLSSQITILLSFLPALLLSGFIFDLRSAPQWANLLAHLLPPVYYLELLKVGFLTGGMNDLVVKNLIILTLFALLVFVVSVRLCQKRVRK